MCLIGAEKGGVRRSWSPLAPPITCNTHRQTTQLELNKTTAFYALDQRYSLLNVGVRLGLSDSFSVFEEVFKNPKNTIIVVT